MESMQIKNYRLVNALALAARGWPVFPVHHPLTTGESPRCSCGDRGCGNVGKHPHTTSGLKDASMDPAVIDGWWSRWPGANVGIATGLASGLLVIDIDPRDGGDESFATLCDEHGTIPDTVEVVTGSGGRHLYLAYPASQMVRNSTGRLGRGIDVRGQGGYVVAPISVHRSGGVYDFAAGASPDDAAIADVPAWLLALLSDRSRPPAVQPPRRPPDTAVHWLGKALARATVEPRNDTGLWLATQLRDNGVSEGEAEATMIAYAQRVPQGDHPYTEAEARQTNRQAYSRSPREPARGPEPIRVTRTAAAVRVTPVATGAAAELSSYLRDIVSGKIVNVPWPWPQLSSLTQALIPGTVTCIVGDPGTKKTFFNLQCLAFWEANGIESAAFFVEKDRKFHTMRLLAMLDANAKMIDFEWLPKNGAIVESAMATHAATLDRVGRRIDSAPTERVTLASILGWIRQQASAGRRVITVDPITAVDAGEKRWTADADFMMEAQSIMVAHGASLVLTTHSKKGNRPGAATGHDIAGGASYHRFADTTIWLHRAKKVRDVRCLNRMGEFPARTDLFFQLEKTRNGRGQNFELAYSFGVTDAAEFGKLAGQDGLLFKEFGVVVADAAGHGEAA